MMRITPIEGTEVARFRIEGRITGATAGEMAASCMPHLDGVRGAVLDLSEVAYADQAGVDMLVALRGRGAVLAGSSGLLRELLREEPKRERTLIDRLRAGEEAAFEKIVQLHGGRMLAVARRLLRSEEDARDSVQDAFLSAFRGLDRFSGEARLSTWLHRIVVNAALMKLRRRRRKPEASIEELLPRYEEDGHQVEPPAPWEGTAENLLERHETRAMVRACIEKLPEGARTVLLLRDIEELDTSEVADVLGVTPNAVKIRLHRARQALRTLIDRELRTLADEVKS